MKKTTWAGIQMRLPFDALRTLHRKNLRDLWNNRARTLLVALSIAIGVLGVGMIVATWNVLNVDLYKRYAAIHPAHLEIEVLGAVQPSDVEKLRDLPGVTASQGRIVFTTRYRHTRGETSALTDPWQPLQLITIPEPETQSVNQIALVQGAWFAQTDELLVERASLSEMGAAVGEPLVVDAFGNGIVLNIAGTVHQQDDVVAAVRGSPVALVDENTMRRVRGTAAINIIYLTVQDLNQRPAIADAARKQLEARGFTVARITQRDPNVHPAQDVLNVLFVVMGVLGVLALLMSSFLVTNTISALVTQQIKQIGVMKALGADTRLVAVSYGEIVLAYGLVGTVLAVPFAERLGYRLAEFLATQINVDLFPYRPSPIAFIVMIGVGLAIPLIAASKPLLQGARLTVREAIADYGIGGGSGNNALARFVARIRNLPRVWALALRNAMRVPERLVLTLITLMLGGAILIAVLSTDSSFGLTVTNLIEGQYGMDAILTFEQPQRLHRVTPVLEGFPDVTRSEAWYFAQATMQLPQGNQVQVTMNALPSDTQFYSPRLQSGRWFQASDTDAIVVNRKWAEQEGVRLGDTVKLDLGERYPVTDWRVVGIVQDLVRQQTGVFIRYENLERIVKETDRTQTLLVRYPQHDLASQVKYTRALTDYFNARGVAVFSTQTMGNLKNQVTSMYRILVIFLLVMAGLMALVGGLGLMGMLSINVLERSKEIGVMRAIGADTPALLQIFWGESIVIALTSFALALALSVPLSIFMTRLVGRAFIKTPLDFAYAYNGIFYWLAVVVVIGTLASIIPALNAARLSVRECLNYE
ncbi:MAG: ABC transporter permease [Chloroflexi bacterium]|nr:ABC transporter permease [Chloroflexota bacterium]